MEGALDTSASRVADISLTRLHKEGSDGDLGSISLCQAMPRKKRRKTTSNEPTPEEPQQDGVNGDFNAWMKTLQMVVKNLPDPQIQVLQKNAGTVHDLNFRREKVAQWLKREQQSEYLSDLTNTFLYLLQYIIGRFGEEAVVNDLTDHMFPRDKYIDMLEESDDEREST